MRMFVVQYQSFTTKDYDFLDISILGKIISWSFAPRMKNNTKKFLIIDDDEINNLICTHIIKSYDDSIQVQSSISAVEALDKIKSMAVSNCEDLPDVILLDINMPIMSGWEFIEEYQKLDTCVSEKIRVFVLTSSQDRRDVEIASQYAQVRELFTKPLSISILDKIESSYL